jgi:hypothetical protein
MQRTDSGNPRGPMLLPRSPPQSPHRQFFAPSLSSRRKNLCSQSSKQGNPRGDLHRQMQIDIPRKIGEFSPSRKNYKIFPNIIFLICAKLHMIWWRGTNQMFGTYLTALTPCSISKMVPL